MCQCGHYDESTEHFWLNCPIFAAHRQYMLDRIRNITNVSLDILLYGDENLNYDANVQIFSSVHDFLISTRRFIT